MPNALDQAAATLTALAALAVRLEATPPEARPLVLSDAICAAGGQVVLHAEDHPTVYEFSLHGITGNALDVSAAANLWLTNAVEALSGRDLAWAELIVRVPVPAISYHRLLQAAATVRAASSDAQALWAAEGLVDAAVYRMFPEQRVA